MKIPAVFCLPLFLGAQFMAGQQAQSALPAGTVAPAAVAPAPATANSDATVVEEIIVRVNSSIISRSDLKRSEDQMAAEQSKQDPNASPENAPQQKDLLRDLIDQQLLLNKGRSWASAPIPSW